MNCFVEFLRFCKFFKIWNSSIEFLIFFIILKNSWYFKQFVDTFASSLGLNAFESCFLLKACLGIFEKVVVQFHTLHIHFYPSCKVWKSYGLDYLSNKDIPLDRLIDWWLIARFSFNDFDLRLSLISCWVLPAF